MFEALDALAADAILKLIAEHQQDTRARKVDLGVGVYRDQEGRTPVLASVKKAERHLLEHQETKSYLGSGGDPVFNDQMQRITFGDAFAGNDRITTLQTPGGSGSLRIAAGLLLRARPDVRVWISDPSWNNHVPLLGGAGLRLEKYPYYDAETRGLRFDDMMTKLATVPAGDVVLLHACCHNPTGLDPRPDQWSSIADLIVERNLVPFIDIAYQGFATGLEEDALPVRLLADRVPEMLVSSSCSKNFGLYRDRVGTLSLLSADAKVNAAVRSQAYQIVRTMYSVPPDHGCAVVSHILRDRDLRAEWLGELAEMRGRLKAMRRLLVDALGQHAPGRDFSHVVGANGMFSFLGVTPEQVQRLKADYAVYMVDSGRINVAGITPANVEYLATSIAAVL